MRVLVTGAGGGAATFLVQISRAHGAEVVVTSSSDAAIERAIGLGAARGVRYTDADWPEQVGEVDLVVDSAGTPAWAGALRCLRRGGTLVSFGRTAGVTAEIDLPSLFYGQWNVLGTTMGSPREFDALLAHVDGADWRPVVDSVFPLEQAAAAHERLDQAGRFGKVVLECRST
jgi:NADPH:quinone reductase-like Zn-dependent oxidoreductase